MTNQTADEPVNQPRGDAVDLFERLGSVGLLSGDAATAPASQSVETLLAQVDAWHAEREDLRAAGERGAHVRPTDWKRSNDQAAGLLRTLAAAYRAERGER